MTLKSAFIFLSVLIAGKGFAQDSTANLLSLVDKDQSKREYVYGAFKSSRIIMSQSIEMLRPGILDFRILHRFGRVNGGAYEFFGLDGSATVRLGLDYGISKKIAIGIGHSTTYKELDGFLKYRAVQQATGPNASPVSLVFAGGLTRTTLKTSDGDFQKYFASRMAYYEEVIVGRKFSEACSFQIMYTILQRDFKEKDIYPDDLHALGFGGRIKISKRVSINADYQYIINQKAAAGLHNPLSVGFDIETGGHVFQLHFTNSAGMNERAIISGTQYDWGKGDIFFGFNISRSFQIKKRKD